jgi:hypothetical protein
MQDMKTHLDKLRAEAAECRRISDAATLPEKRDLFARLAAHHLTLADEIEKAMQAGTHHRPGSASRQ